MIEAWVQMVQPRGQLPTNKILLVMPYVGWEYIDCWFLHLIFPQETFLWVLQFPLPSKTNIFKFQFDA